MDLTKVNFPNLLEQLTNIGISLSAEKDHSRLRQSILGKAMELTNADGGTLYTRTDDNHLQFEIMITQSLGIYKGGASGKPIDFYPISLYDQNHIPNTHMVASWAVLHGRTVNIEDAYADLQFDFSGTREFDKKTGYRSKSFLTVPLTNHENENIGVLQLLNAINPESGAICAFSSLDQQVVESLASQAAVTVTNRSLIDAQKNLFDAMIQLIANAIDEKSAYTGGHCRRVPALTNMIADAACRIDHGPLKDFHMDEDDTYALDVAGWLHDCGKITTPEYVVDKATKLETIFDRVELVNTRFASLRQEAEIRMLRRLIQARGSGAVPEDPQLQTEILQLQEDAEFIKTINVGAESTSAADQDRVREIGARQWTDVEGTHKNLLTENEQHNLMIGRGALTVRERPIINNHITVTIEMLESLPYPNNLRKAPEFASGH